MQALEKITVNNSWITLILLVLFIGIFLLRGLNPTKLNGYAFSFFNVGFIEKEAEEKTNFFKAFYSIIFIFTVAVLSLVAYKFKNSYTNLPVQTFTSFLPIFISFLFYFSLKWLLEFTLSSLFLIKKEVRFFLTSKSSYLYSISFVVFIAFILFQYARLNLTYLYYITGFLFIFRFILHFLNNKNLIFNKLFYFILYFCAFEVAPLFILFKMML